MWTSEFFPVLASTCVALNPVCRTRFLLSHQRGQQPRTAFRCGQPGSCASNSPKVMHKDRQISGEVTAQAGFSPGGAAPCTPSGSPAAWRWLAGPCAASCSARRASASQPGPCSCPWACRVQRRGPLRPVKGTGSSFFPAGCQVRCPLGRTGSRSVDGPCIGFCLLFFNSSINQ